MPSRSLQSLPIDIDETNIIRAQIKAEPFFKSAAEKLSLLSLSHSNHSFFPPEIIPSAALNSIMLSPRPDPAIGWLLNGRRRIAASLLSPAKPGKEYTGAAALPPGDPGSLPKVIGLHLPYIFSMCTNPNPWGMTTWPRCELSVTSLPPWPSQPRLHDRASPSWTPIFSASAGWIRMVQARRPSFQGRSRIFAFAHPCPCDCRP